MLCMNVLAQLANISTNSRSFTTSQKHLPGCALKTVVLKTSKQEKLVMETFLVMQQDWVSRNVSIVGAFL